MADTVHLVDGSLYVCRAWFAQVPDAEDADGHPVHAVHGFARFLLDLLERARPTHIAVAFDESLNTSFRNALYPAYKANRPAAPEDLMRQFAGCKAVALASISIRGSRVQSRSTRIIRCACSSSSRTTRTSSASS